MSRSDIIEISGMLVPPMETQLAYHFNDGTKDVWLPKQYCEWDPDAGEMSMPEWLAEEKELI